MWRYGTTKGRRGRAIHQLKSCCTCPMADLKCATGRGVEWRDRAQKDERRVILALTSRPSTRERQKVTRHMRCRAAKGPGEIAVHCSVQIQMQVHHSGASTQLPPRAQQRANREEGGEGGGANPDVVVSPWRPNLAWWECAPAHGVGKMAAQGAGSQARKQLARAHRGQSPSVRSARTELLYSSTGRC